MHQILSFILRYKIVCFNRLLSKAIRDMKLKKGMVGRGSICRMKGLRVLGYSCGSNVVRRGSKRDTGELYNKYSCTFLSSGLPLIGRSFKGSAGNKFRLASKKTAALTRNGGRRSARRSVLFRSLFILSVDPPFCWSRKGSIKEGGKPYEDGINIQNSCSTEGFQTSERRGGFEEGRGGSQAEAMAGAIVKIF